MALRLTYAEQQRVRSLSLFEPVAFHLLAGDDPGHAEVYAVRRAVQAELQAGDMLAGVARFIDYWSGRGAFFQMPADKQAALARLLPKVALDFQAIASELLGLADYRRIAMPTCRIGGHASPLAPHRVLAALSTTLPDQQTHWGRRRAHAGAASAAGESDHHGLHQSGRCARRVVRTAERLGCGRGSGTTERRLTNPFIHRLLNERDGHANQIKHRIHDHP